MSGQASYNRSAREISRLHSARARNVNQQGAMTADWSRKFDDPIPLPKGRRLVTLKDAGTYITKLPKLPKAEHTAAEWQAAMEALILVATLENYPVSNGLADTFFTRISPLHRQIFYAAAALHANRLRIKLHQ